MKLTNEKFDEVVIQIVTDLKPFMAGVTKAMNAFDELMNRVFPSFVRYHEYHRMHVKKVHTDYRKKRKGRW